MGLREDLDRVAEVAAGFADEDERVVGVIPTEPSPGLRVYLCAFEGEGRSWLALDESGVPLDELRLVREAVSIAAMCEIAAEAAAGGDLHSLRAELAELRETEAPEGIDEADAAAAELAGLLAEEPHLASLAELDRIGAATHRLELALGDSPGSPFAEVMKRALAPVEELIREVLAGYKRPLA